MRCTECFFFFPKPRFETERNDKREEKWDQPHLVVVDASDVVVLVISRLEQQQRLVPLHLDAKLLLVVDVTVGRLQ